MNEKTGTKIKADVVREICRALTRLEKTELVVRYTGVIIGLARKYHDPDIEHEFRAVPKDPAGELSSFQFEELTKWIKDYPWYAFTLVVGLALGDEDRAWGLAYG